MWVWENFVEGLVSGAQKFGIGKLAILGLVGAGIVAALAAIVLNLSAQPMQLLFSGVDPKDASSMTAALDQAGTKYKITPDGTSIMVPRDKVGPSRLLLAGKGLLNAGSAGYSLFDTQSVLGQTDAQQKVQMTRALDGELRNNIMAMDGVTYANVLINQPEHQLFEDEPGKPSASVTIGMGGRKATPEMVQAVQNLVANTVPGMRPEMVAVIDKKGMVLSASSSGEMSAALADTRKTEVEAGIRARLTDLVEKIVGPGNARVEVSADLDMTSVSETANVYDPDKQVVQSEQSVDQNSKDTTSNSTTPVTAASNTPAGADGGGADTGANSSGSTQATTNYLNSNTVTTKVTQPGATKRLSVSVVINEAPGAADAAGVVAPTATAQQIQAAVSAAMGFDQARGDQLKVTSIAFKSAATPADPKAKGPGILAGFGKNDIMRIIELVVLAVVAVLILLLGVRPLIKALGLDTKVVHSMAPMQMLTGGGQGMNLPAGMSGGGGQHAIGPNGEHLAISGPEGAHGIDMARIEGQVKASSVKQVAEFVEKHPDESVSILRSWLHETA
ncbi:MAG: fliF [Caulobacteraceae bacterium]|nr:fliF [Caulobacteraceae bacterium]